MAFGLRNNSKSPVPICMPTHAMHTQVMWCGVCVLLPRRIPIRALSHSALKSAAEKCWHVHAPVHLSVPAVDSGLGCLSLQMGMAHGWLYMCKGWLPSPRRPAAGVWVWVRCRMACGVVASPHPSSDPQGSRLVSDSAAVGVMWLLAFGVLDARGMM